jgi:hypothetical protein
MPFTAHTPGWFSCVPQPNAPITRLQCHGVFLLCLFKKYGMNKLQLPARHTVPINAFI